MLMTTGRAQEVDNLMDRARALTPDDVAARIAGQWRRIACG